ncbi:hypothetical protein F5B18DRAFT_646743 [Nemania serpens]|nr:hypothetical protein F5B18DRAFT_646743 [Nemania serpens]
MPITYSNPRRRRTSSSIRPVQWSDVDSEAIHQWRDLAERPRSTNNESPSRERHEDGSEDHASSNNKFFSTAHLKYLIRGFLRQVPETTNATPNREEVPNQESFVPSPMITFLIDEADDLVCQICHEISLKLAVTAEHYSPDMTSILPCGHIFCHNCISVWLMGHDSCPFCRVVMTHPGCKHQVQPRSLAHDTIHTLPDTLAKGGVIGDICFRCADRDRRDVSLQRWTDLAKRFKAARREAEELGTDEAVENMRKAQKAFERLPEDDFWVLSKRQHRQW